MKKVLSVIIPAYNAELTLERCISSLIVPEILDKLEVIIINDGSTDSTGIIADRYMVQYPQSIMVIHKENGGHGSGINAAVQIANGYYFRVVDADDWLITENLPAYLRELESCKSDIVINSFYRVKIKSRKKIPVQIQEELQGKKKTLEELLPFLDGVRNCFTIHGITYQTEAFRISDIKLSEKIFYEDNEFTTLPFWNIHTIFFSPLFLYQYQVGDQQQSMSDQNQVLRLSQLEQVLNKICKVYREDKRFSSAAQVYLLQKISVIVTSYLAVCLIRNPNRKEGKKQAEFFMEHLKREYTEIYQKNLGQYQKLLKMHFFHVNGKSLDFLLDSSFYFVIRKYLRKPR